MRTLQRTALAALIVSVLFRLPPQARCAEAHEPVQIGMVATLFRDAPEPVVVAMMQPFAALMESQTGVAGQLVLGGDAIHLGRLLAEDRVQIGVFHGIEFAWAREKYPGLRPLMIAVNQHSHLRAFVVVRADVKWESLQDLKGKRLAVPSKSREHCRLFVAKHCMPANGSGSCAVKVDNAEDALDDVLDGEVDGAIVDGVAWECFQRRKPGRSARLRVLKASEIFPAAVVAYVPGRLDEDTVQAFRDGLISANRSVLGRQFLTLWKLTGFEPVPADYEQTLTEILKAYPKPFGGETK